jgi:hypothetical protein
MRCLYCGKHLALLRKLTGGGEFCSDAHRDKYQEEYNRLAVSRLIQAQARPDEVKKPTKKKAEAAPAAAADGGGGGGGGRAAVAVEPVETVETVETKEAGIEVVAFSTQFFHQQLSPVAVTPEWMPVEFEPVLSLNSPELASLPEVTRPALDPADMRLHGEADFLTLRPQPERAGVNMIATAFPLAAEATYVFPFRSDSQLVMRGLVEADAITGDSLPAPGMHAFEPLTPGMAALEFPRPEPTAGTTSFSPAVNDFSTAGLVGLTLISLPPEDGALEFETSLPFHYMLERRPSFDAGLTLLDREAETANVPLSVETPAQVVNGIASARPEPVLEVALEVAPEPALEPAPEPAIVTPRRVLEVLSRMHGDGRESTGQQQVAAPVQPAAPQEEPPPASQTLKPLTIPALAPSPAALTAGFPAITIGIQPRLLPYIPLPLRPKMAVGNALGPRVARNGGSRNAGGRKGQPDSPKNMTRSMLHLEDQASDTTDTDAESPTLFGKLGGLFGKKHKNH